MKYTIVLSLCLCIASAPVFADSMSSGDAAAGETVFNQCKACHAIVSDDGAIIFRGGKTGPNLYGIDGRIAGAYEGYRYSSSMVKAGEEGLIWNESGFIEFVTDPRGYMRELLDDNSARSKMSFKLRSEEDALNVWAYLASLSLEGQATN